MLVLSVWVSLQCVGGWVPVKWRYRLITDWRQTRFSPLPTQAKQRKRDLSRCKKKSPSVDATPLLPKRQMTDPPFTWALHINRAALERNMPYPSTPATSLQASVEQGGWFQPGRLFGCKIDGVKPRTSYLLWRWNGTGVRQEGSSVCWWIAGLNPPCLQSWSVWRSLTVNQ